MGQCSGGGGGIIIPIKENPPPPCARHCLQQILLEHEPSEGFLENFQHDINKLGKNKTTNKVAQQGQTVHRSGAFEN